MNGMIDGVNKVFTVQHDAGAMHVTGFENERAMVEEVMGYMRLQHTPEDCIAWLESLHAKIDATVLRIKQYWEIDGHSVPAAERDANG